MGTSKLFHHMSANRLDTLAPHFSNCAACGKNLQVMRRKYIIYDEDRAFCSLFCHERELGKDASKRLHAAALAKQKG